MLKPPCELGPLAIEIELFDLIKSSSSIFITSNEYGFVEVFYSLCSDAHPYGRAGGVGCFYTGVAAMLALRQAQ